MESTHNVIFGMFGNICFQTKTTAEWEASDYILLKGELVFSLDLVDPEDPLSAVIKAKIGQGGLKWYELPYWKTESESSQYRPVKVLIESDFIGNDYSNPDWIGLVNYQVMYMGSRLTNQITKKPSGGIILNEGFQLFGNELLVIF